MTLNEFKSYMKGYKDALNGAYTDADCRKMLERIFELLESVIEAPGITVYPDRLYPVKPFEITWLDDLKPKHWGELTCEQA